MVDEGSVGVWEDTRGQSVHLSCPPSLMRNDRHTATIHEVLRELDVAAGTDFWAFCEPLKWSTRVSTSCCLSRIAVVVLLYT